MNLFACKRKKLLKSIQRTYDNSLRLTKGLANNEYIITTVNYCAVLKSSKQLNALELFSLITSKIFQLTHRYRYQFVGDVMADMRSIQEMIQCATQGDEKMQFLFLLLFVLTF